MNSRYIFAVSLYTLKHGGFGHRPFLYEELVTSCDEDISTVDTTIAPAATHPHAPPLQGPLTRARACQLNYQVLSFLGTLPNIHENKILPKLDVFMLLRNDGPSMDEWDKHWSMMVHGDDNKLVRIEDDATSGDFRTLKPP